MGKSSPDIPILRIRLSLKFDNMCCSKKGLSKFGSYEKTLTFIVEIRTSGSIPLKPSNPNSVDCH